MAERITPACRRVSLVREGEQPAPARRGPREPRLRILDFARQFSGRRIWECARRHLQLGLS